MVYGNDDKLLYMLTPEGTATRTEGSAGTIYTYNYFKTDHLGSTRVLLSAVNGTLQASQTTDFYPFRLTFEYSNLNKNKYLSAEKSRRMEHWGMKVSVGMTSAQGSTIRF